MSVFAKLFSKKAVLGRLDCNLDPPPTPVFDPSIVRLVIFQERSSGRVPLYDSKAIEKVEDGILGSGKSNIEPRRWTRGCRSAGSSSLPPQSPSSNSLGVDARCKSLPVPKVAPGGQIVPTIAHSGGKTYRLTKPPSDIKMLAEMAFGALPMKSVGVDLKIHEIRNPHQLMMSQVFNLSCATTNHGSIGESTREHSICSQPSTPSSKGNSRFYLHLNALDASVDSPQHHLSNRRCSDFAAVVNSNHANGSSHRTALLGESASHGDLSRGAETKSDDGTPLQKSVSASLLGSDEKIVRGSRNIRGDVLPENDSTPIARSKPVDVPSFHLDQSDDELSQPSASVSSDASSCVSSPRHSSSLFRSHRRARHLSRRCQQPVVDAGSSEFNGLSSRDSAGNASSVCSSLSSAFGGSYASVHKRWIRSQAKSLEFVGKSMGGQNKSERTKDSGCGRQRNLESLFNGPLAKKEPSTKIAFSLVLDLESPSLSSQQNVENFHLKSVSVLKTFLFTHSSLIESHLRVLRGVIETAVVGGNKKDFIHDVARALDELRGRLNDLITSPRLPNPLWLRLTSSTGDESTHKIPDHLREKNRSLCFAFLSKFAHHVDRLDTKYSNYFLSSLLTAVLTKHLAWVSTVAPPAHVSGASPTTKSSRFHYLQKRLAPWAVDSDQWNAYNPLWGQLGDLFGAVTFPLKVSQTVVVGSKKDVVRDLLFILSYFIRCSDVLSADKAHADDLWDQAINMLLLQESIMSNRSGDTIVDAVLALSASGIKSCLDDLDDKTIELQSPRFHLENPEVDEEEDEDDDDFAPMFRPRSNTVVERKSNSGRKNCEANDAHEGKQQFSCVAPISDEIGLPRKDSGVLVDNHPRLQCQDGCVHDDPSLHDSGCYEVGRDKFPASKCAELPASKCAEFPVAQSDSASGEITVLDPNNEKSERQISSTLGLPDAHRSKTHSIDSQYSSKTSSTCQSDEGFDSIPSEAASKNGSPPSLQDAARMKKGVNELRTADLVDILDPSTLSGLNANQNPVTSDAKKLSSKPSTLLSGASASFDLEVTDVPCILIDEAALFDDTFGSATKESLDNADLKIKDGESLASNFGFSLLGNVHDTFRPDFALQGTTDRDFVKTQLPLHLRRQLEHSFLDDRVSTSCCIVADVDRSVVEVYSTENSDPTSPVRVTPANMVVGIAESLRDLFRVSFAASSSACSSTTPELCLAHLEDKLQEIYFKSLTFSQLLPNLNQLNGKDRNELRSLVGFEMSDVPLLAAVASTHEENI